MTSQTKIYKIYNYLIRLGIVVFTYGFIYYEVFYRRDLGNLWSDFLEKIKSGQAGLYILLLVFLMMIVNWLLETTKWKLLISKIERVLFINAFKAVLTGISVSFFTPNRTGDYLGRVFILKKANRMEGVLLTVVGSFSQIIVTMGTGLASLLYFLHAGLISSKIHSLVLTGITILIPALVLLSLLIYYNISFFSSFIVRRLPEKWRKYEHYLTALSQYSSKELTGVLGLSFLRFMVFSTQYYLLLLLFSVQLPYVEGLMLISLIYLVMLIVPTVALVEVGVRGSVSIYIFGLYLSRYQTAIIEPEIAVFTASTLLWLINLVIPAVLGTFFVYALRFFRR